MSREGVLERIKAALAVPAETASALRGPDEPPTGDPVALFVERGGQVGAKVERVASLAEAAARVVVLCAERGARTATAWEAPELDGVLAAVRGVGLAVLPPDAAPPAVAAADVGITGADWGIAESGTLVLASGPGRPRLASLLPAVHLAVLRADRILPDLPALFARTADLPSALTFVTGPSRSADIGFTPVLGAHGPTEVVVLVVDAPSRRRPFC
jgi:L-lactate utilization protein LutC